MYIFLLKLFYNGVKLFTNDSLSIDDNDTLDSLLEKISKIHQDLTDQKNETDSTNKISDKQILDLFDEIKSLYKSR